MATHMQVITDNLDLWTSALLTKSTAGRGSNGRVEAYGIKKLRELILELAVRGKLVPQDPDDEPASVLLQKIEDEKARLITAGAIKRGKLLPNIGDDEKPHNLPHGWEWSRLQSLSIYIQRGKGPAYSENGKVRVVSQKCVQWSGFDLTQARYVDDTSLDGYLPERFLKMDDLLWNSTGTGTVGRINVVPEVGDNTLVADSHVTTIRPLFVNSGFLRCFIAGPGIQQRIEPGHENSLVSGTTNQVELNLSAVIQLAVPVPPLAEQHRIVAKVDELMALCDQLEQQQANSIEAHQTLVETLLGTLTNVASQQELNEAWTRIADHFDTLFITEQSIDQLKQTILQLAVMGKLVPQDPNDEPASVLINKVTGLRKLKNFSVISEVDVPFEVSSSWRWVRFGDFLEVTSSKRIHVSDYVTEGIPFFRSKEIGELKKRQTISTDIFISVDKYESLKDLSGFPRVGDLMLTSVGSIGNTWICDGRDFYYKDGNITKIGSHGYISMRYVQCFIDAPIFTSQVTDTVSGTAYNALTIVKLNNLCFPLPPLAEQHRIVAKVDELMALCDTLKARLADAQTTQLHLADTIVDQAVA